MLIDSGLVTRLFSGKRLLLLEPEYLGHDILIAIVGSGSEKSV
jgi:hypothetical protein